MTALDLEGTTVHPIKNNKNDTQGATERRWGRCSCGPLFEVDADDCGPPDLDNKLAFCRHNTPTLTDEYIKSYYILLTCPQVYGKQVAAVCD